MILIDTLPELFAAFKERKLFGLYLNCLTGLWIPAGIASIFFDIETAESPDFNPFALNYTSVIESNRV